MGREALMLLFTAPPHTPHSGDFSLCHRDPGHSTCQTSSDCEIQLFRRIPFTADWSGSTQHALLHQLHNCATAVIVPRPRSCSTPPGITTNLLPTHENDQILFQRIQKKTTTDPSVSCEHISMYFSQENTEG